MSCTICKAPIGRDNRSGLCGKHYQPTLFYRYVGGPKLSLDDIATLRVDRDPCTYCGVRGDVGCKHKRWAA